MTPAPAAGTLCAYCRERRAVTKDHVVPKSFRKTRPHRYPNLPKELRGTVPCCFECNIRKSTRKLVPRSWTKYIPLLQEVFPGPWRVWDGNPRSPEFKRVVTE